MKPAVEFVHHVDLNKAFYAVDHTEKTEERKQSNPSKINLFSRREE